MFVPKGELLTSLTERDNIFCLHRYIENIGVICSEDWEQITKKGIKLAVPLPWNSDVHNIV